MPVQILQYRRAWAVGVVLLSLTGQGRSAGFESLLRSSPFGQPAVVPTGGPAVQPLEFRGMMFEDGKEYFSVHETKTRASAWVGIDEAGNPYTIRGYDTARGILTVEYQGSLLDLPLKNAVILISSSGSGRPKAMTPGGAVAAAPAVEGGYRDAINARLAEEARRQRVASRPKASDSPPGSGPDRALLSRISPPRNLGGWFDYAHVTIVTSIH